MAPLRIAASALVLALAGCGGGGPSAGDPVRISENDRAYGAEQHPRLLAEFGGAYDGPEAAYTKAVGARIADAAGLAGQCTITLVNSDVVNAFAVPGCYIYVTRGLFAIVTSEAELASVLGHELGHIVGDHSRRQERRSIWRTIGVIAVSLTGSEGLTRLAGQAAQYFTLRYSRAQEYESDTLGIGYLGRAGYDPHAAPDMLAALGRHEAFMTATGGPDEARAIPEWARSHPLTANRIERARGEARATGLADDQLPEREAAYLAEVDGLLYGDDPEQGFVLGRSFAHPVMRIFFEAPPGYTLTNSPRAIGIEGPGGIRGEFGGGALPRGGIAAYAEALAGEIVGQAPAEVLAADRGVTNGLPSVRLVVGIATERGTVPVTIAAFAMPDGAAYHFVMVAGPGTDPLAAGALFDSFRVLSPAEAARLRPRQIRVVRAGPGDTVASIAARMPADDPARLLRVLNGLDADRPLAPGQPVKVVAWR